MRLSILLRSLLLGLAALGGITATNGEVSTGESPRPFDGKTFHGRIAFSSDGNCNDEDDWGAFPVAAALLDAFGVTGKLVHVDYSNILVKNDPRFYREMETSVLGSAERCRIPSSILFDCQKNLAGAVESIRNAINASSADNPLYYVLAGPMEVPLLGIRKSDPDKRNFVYCISHSGWNDGFSQPEKRYLHRFTKRDVIETGVHWVQVKSGSGLTNSTRTSSTPEQWGLYHWMRDSKDARLGWIYSRLKVEERCDVSDATMTYFLLTGDESATPAKLQAVLDDKKRPAPPTARMEVRIEAENFRSLENFVLDDANDRNASHRLSVSQKSAGIGRLRTIFNQPYAPRAGTFDVEVRYRSGREGGTEFRLFVGGAPQGAAWTGPRDAETWHSKTIGGVRINAEDEIMVEVRSAGSDRGQVDYISLAPQVVARAAGTENATKKSLTIGAVQLALEPQLSKNRDKIAGFIRQAKERSCQIVVFPETALYWPEGTTKGEIDAAVAHLQQVVDTADIYALIGGPDKRTETDKPFERLVVIDPAGRIVHSQIKLGGPGAKDVPGMFAIDGVPCAAAICADRWTRSVEELPAFAGAKVLFEISNNFDNEWVPDLDRYWWAPRAVRNGVFVVMANTARENRAQPWEGHGHSVIFGPNGKTIGAAGEESDKLLVATLDLSHASATEATKRRNHPALKPFWDAGVDLLNGRKVTAAARPPRTSAEVELKIAAAQMACSQRIHENVAKITKMIRAAAQEHSDAVVFPELAVTGARDADISAATQQQLEQALAAIQQAARDAKVTVACGLPWFENGRRQNCAVVIGPNGDVLTRYAQLAVDRERLFAPGTSTKAMWFEINGVPAVVTIGRDALWNEIAELAAMRGAQVHLHLAYDRETSDAARLLRKQIWVNLASFRTFTATVNAASPAGLAHPSAAAIGGSAIWQDFQRTKRKIGGLDSYCAVPMAEAQETETLLYAAQQVPKSNPLSDRLARGNRQITPWYVLGAGIIDTLPDKAEPAKYFPPAESRGGWRALVSPNETPSAEQKAGIRKLAGLDWDRLHEAWTYGRGFPGPNNVLVIRRGHIAGEWFTDRNNRGIASCTKSLTSLATAKLCELSAAGKFSKKISFDEPAWKYLPESWVAAEPRRKAITIRHMLTMTSGLDPYDGPYQDLDAYGNIILTRPFEAAPGEVWAYASAPVDLLSLIVENVSGQLLGDFFNEHISRPIGAAPIDFPKFGDHSGGSGGPKGGARLPARDLARIGHLLLHAGLWRDETGEKQIFKSETVKLLTHWEPQLKSATYREPNYGRLKSAQNFYGYLFWTNRTREALGKNVPADAFYMSGWGKQACYVIPSLDMVVVRLGPHAELNNHPEYHPEFLARIIAAVVAD